MEWNLMAVANTGAASVDMKDMDDDVPDMDDLDDDVPDMDDLDLEDDGVIEVRSRSVEP
jgi:hypothetical protein